MTEHETPEEECDSFFEMGIDVGAISTKLLLLKNGREVLGRLARPTTMEPGKLAKGMMDELLAPHSLTKADVTHMVATGQGRRAISFADMARTEITAFARAVHFLHPQASVAVDIGGQGIRVMKMGEMGIISDFRTGSKCSSGTGCFLDTMALALEVDMENMGELSLSSCHPESISTTCTVFAESEVVSLVAKGKGKEDILAGLNGMVAKKVGALINATRSHGPVFLGGGVALNTGVVEALKDRLDREVLVAEQPQFVGALGAALLAPKPGDEEEADLDWWEEEKTTKGSLLQRLRSWRGKK